MPALEKRWWLLAAILFLRPSDAGAAADDEPAGEIQEEPAGETRAEPRQAGTSLLTAPPRDVLEIPPVIHPIAVQQAELWGNPYGGNRQEIVYTGVANFGLIVDLEAAGWSRGTSVGAQGLWVQGRNISPLAVGDAGIVSNIAGVSTVRLFKWWLRQRFLGGLVDLKLGQIPLDDDFMVLDSALLFINSGFGTPQTEALNVPAPIYPLGALGMRLRLKPAGAWELLFGAYDGDAGTESEYPHLADLTLGSGDGAMMLAEIAWRDEPRDRPAQISLGGFYHLGRVRHFEEERRARGLASAYVMLERALASFGESDLTLLGHGAIAFPAPRAVVSTYADVGLVLGGGPWRRPEDDLGVGFASTRFGKAYLARTRAGGDAVTAAEHVLEVTYRAAPLPWIALQPSAQWVFQPHFSRDNSLALAIRLTVEL